MRRAPAGLSSCPNGKAWAWACAFSIFHTSHPGLTATLACLPVSKALTSDLSRPGSKSPGKSRSTHAARSARPTFPSRLADGWPAHCLLAKNSRAVIAMSAETLVCHRGGRRAMVERARMSETARISLGLDETDHAGAHAAGNAVTPAVARWIANHLTAHIKGKTIQPAWQESEAARQKPHKKAPKATQKSAKSRAAQQKRQSAGKGGELSGNRPCPHGRTDSWARGQKTVPPKLLISKGMLQVR